MDDDRLRLAREEISDVDRDMARLFQRRMDAARTIAAYKRERGLPILDAAQERVVIERDLAFIEQEELRGLYVQFLKQLMDISKVYQRRLMGGMRVAYSGIEGDFADIAARRIFPDAETVARADFQAAYEAVERGACDVCVLPVENSCAGEVDQVTDLMFNGTLYVTGMYALPVTQHLLGVPGATLGEIRRVVSHPQALSQCAGFIRLHSLEAVQAANTARAAQSVIQAGDRSTAAIASIETARLYGLSVLAQGISESSLSATRFAVFSRAENRQAQAAGFMLLFTVDNTAGALARAVSVIGQHGFNMRVLRSRPVRDLPWRYYFFAELEGDDRSKAGQAMLAALKPHCHSVKIVGRYGPEVILKKVEEA